MAYGGDLLYEENERGERVLVKSLESARRAYLRFTNCTSRRVDIYWRDFEGKKQHYVFLNPGKHFDVNTFLTHPWEFVDQKTNESFVINNKTVFRAPSSIADMRYRTNWNITVPVRTLRHTTILAIASLLPDEASVDILELPRELASDLRQCRAQMGGSTPQHQID